MPLSHRLRAAVCGPLLAILTGSITGCVSHSKPHSAHVSGAPVDAPVKALPSPHSTGPSGIFPLADGPDAFVARLALAGKARHTLDLQYYIWHNDQTGLLLAGAVMQAAERGVKARLLLDDMGTAAKDRTLLILDSHPNVEVRLFNPIGLRSARLLGTLLDFKRVNRRMHNKSLIMDNNVAVVGGRNIGDEYFGAADAMNFADFDVAATGPVVREVADAFDLYWNCRAAVPITKVSREKVTAADLQEGMQDLLAQRESMERSPDAAALRSSKLAATPLHAIDFLQGRAVVVADHPEKVSTRPDDASTHLAPQLRRIVDRTQGDLLLVSPYFIPGKKGVDWFASLRQRGVSVRVITNSLASSDVAAVHAGYARYRQPLLESGVELYEMKSAPAGTNKSTSTASGLGLTGSSESGLHAKTFIFDRRWVFVGSMNLDPRSLNLNTEIGMLIESPALAQQMLTKLEDRLPDHAYRVELTPDGLRWTTRENGQPLRLKSEPLAGFKKRLMWRISSFLPIESQL